MGKFIVNNFYRLCAVVLFSVLLTSLVRADTFHLTDGQSLTGEVVSLDENGIVVKLPDGTYSDHTPWSKFTQADLRDLQQNPKAAAFVEPFIELTQEDKLKRTEIEIKDVPRLPRPANHSILGGLASSGIGLFILLVLYAGNVYAAYEISIFRARPAGLVCGVAAVAPIIGPIIFLSLPQEYKRKAAPEWAPPAEEYADANVAAAIAAEQPAEVAVDRDSPEAHALPRQAAPAPPADKVFLRGQFTFNRRFFETQLPAFFAMVRSDADKDLILNIRASRGSYVAQRIARISANDLQLQVQKNNAFEDVTIPFVEIQEVQIKHRTA
jgi:hypothetical protein